MSISIEEALVRISLGTADQDYLVKKVSDHIDMVKADLRSFIDQRDLSADAVTELEDIISCLE